MIDSPEYFKELGPKIPAIEVAKKLHVNVKWVYDNWDQIGGVRKGRAVMFFENNIVRALEWRGDHHALPKKGQDVDGTGTPQWEEERASRIPEQEGSYRLGERTKRTTIAKLLKADQHGIYNG